MMRISSYIYFRSIAPLLPRAKLFECDLYLTTILCNNVHDPRVPASDDMSDTFMMHTHVFIHIEL